MKQLGEILLDGGLVDHEQLTTAIEEQQRLGRSLGRVLVEVANGPSTMNGAEFDQVRKRIEQQGIIFKVRVFGEYVREGRVPSPVDARVRG